MHPFRWALSRRCPRCGHKPVFDSWYRMTKTCESCGLLFEREPGYWVGAMTVNTAIITILFLATFGAAVWLTWPDPPWVWIAVVVVGLNLLFPVFFYPFAKTLWMAADLTFQKVTDQDEFGS